MGSVLRRGGATVLPIYCDGIEEAEVRDGLTHLSWFVNQRKGVHIVHLRLIVPPPSLVAGGKKINEALSAMWRRFDA
jgi:hypothetical protein